MTKSPMEINTIYSPMDIRFDRHGGWSGYSDRSGPPPFGEQDDSTDWDGANFYTDASIPPPESDTAERTTVGDAEFSGDNAGPPPFTAVENASEGAAVETSHSQAAPPPILELGVLTGSISVTEMADAPPLIEESGDMTGVDYQFTGLDIAGAPPSVAELNALVDAGVTKNGLEGDFPPPVSELEVSMDDPELKQAAPPPVDQLKSVAEKTKPASSAKKSRPTSHKP